MRRITTAAALTALVLSAAACGGDDDSAESAAPPAAPAAPVEGAAADPYADPYAAGGAGDREAEAGTIVMSSLSFLPAEMTVTPGQEIALTNEDPTAHTVEAADKAIDSGDVAAAGASTVTMPAKAGTYDVFCKYHQAAMKMTVTVK